MKEQADEMHYKNNCLNHFSPQLNPSLKWNKMQDYARQYILTQRYDLELNFCSKIFFSCFKHKPHYFFFFRFMLKTSRKQFANFKFKMCSFNCFDVLLMFYVFWSVTMMVWNTGGRTDLVLKRVKRKQIKGGKETSRSLIAFLIGMLIERSAATIRFTNMITWNRKRGCTYLCLYVDNLI